MNWYRQVAETDGDHEAVVVVMERSAAIREAEVEATVENVTVVAVGVAIAAVTREVAAQSIAQVGSRLPSEGPLIPPDKFRY